MRVAILYDGAARRLAAAPDVAGVVESVEAVRASLLELGHEPCEVAADADVPRWSGELRALAPHVVFNLCEGIGGQSALEVHAAAVVELLGLHMTGAPAELLAFARRKDRVNACLDARGIPVPVWAEATAAEPPRGWDLYPAIVKPAAEDASVGITRRSVARDEQELARALREAEPLAPLLVQEFLAGRELNVGFVADTLLPIAEIDFAATPRDAWPMVCYASKWQPGSAEDRSAVPRCPAELSPRERDEVAAIAGAAWQALGGRGYGRVDLRGDDRGRLFVLEVNPNPDLAPSAGLARMAAAAGWSYTRLIDAILMGATP
jgi:D-alanine-D-alanine ligase